MSKSALRGIRNHNPGNIDRVTGVTWQGQAEDQSSDSRFVVFTDPRWGIRAIARVLITYQDKRLARDGSKIDTVDEFIDRWAPKHENDTDAYVAHVRQMLGLGQEEFPGEVDVYRYADMRGLLIAIITHENGVQPYDDATIDAGLRLAGIEPELKPLTQSRTLQGASVIAGSGVATLLEPINAGLSAVQDADAHFSSGNTFRIVLGVVLVAAAMYVAWARLSDRTAGHV
jgi:hypothetical protein